MKTKKILFLVFLCLYGYCGISQNSSIDSLQYYIGFAKEPKSNADLIRAYSYFGAEKERSMNKNSLARVAYSLYGMSNVEFKLGIYFTAEKSAIEALNILNELKTNNVLYDDRGIRRSLYNHLGITHRAFNNYDEALKYYSLALELTEEERKRAIVYNNKGVTYEFLEKYDSALFEYKRAFEIQKRYLDTIETARAMDNMGYIQFMLGDPQGLVNMTKALEIREEINDDDMYPSYKHLALLYTKLNEKQKALSFALKGYNQAYKFENFETKKDILELLINILDQDQYARELIKVGKALDSIDRSNENTFASAKYNFEEQRKKTVQERREKEIAQAQVEETKIISIFIGVIVLISAISLFFILRTRHKKNMLVKQFETEQYISKKLHDEVANDVFHTITKVRGNKTDAPELLDALDGIYHKVRDISKANADLDVSKDFGRLLNDLINSYSTDQVTILTKNASKIVWTDFSEAKRKVLYRVLQELMVNMKKHSQASLVTLNFEKNNQNLSIRYVDNGVGCSLEKGSGLTNTESRMEMVNGEITFESAIGKGFRAHVIL